MFDTHARSVWRYLVLTGSTPSDAEEHVQEVFVRLLRYLKAGGRVTYPKTWLLATARNVRADEWEKRGRQPSASPDDPDAGDRVSDPAPDPETVLLQNERRALLQSALQRLTERQCEYLNLRAEGLRLRDIAEIHGVTVQSVAETCARAIERLGKLAHE